MFNLFSIMLILSTHLCEIKIYMYIIIYIYRLIGYPACIVIGYNIIVCSRLSHIDKELSPVDKANETRVFDRFHEYILTN